MHIYDDKQMNRGHLDISEKWDTVAHTDQMSTLVVIIPEIGAFVTYRGESYEIISTQTYQEGWDVPNITTLCRITRIDDEGDQMPIESITVRADELELI